MALLNEYLGALMAHLNQARVLADLESAKTALIYSENNLLRHFTVPRLKFDSIELTVPIAIDDMTIVGVGSSATFDGKKLANLTYAEILKVLNITSFPRETSASIQNNIKELVDKLAPEMPKDTFENILRGYAWKIIDVINGRIPELIEKKMVEDEEKAKEALLELRTSLPKVKDQIDYQPNTAPLNSVKVTIETDKLKEKSPATLMVIKIRVTEESMEWERMMDNNGNVVDKLMPS